MWEVSEREFLEENGNTTRGGITYAVKFPAAVTSLDTGLAHVDGDAFCVLEVTRREREREVQRKREEEDECH